MEKAAGRRSLAIAEAALLVGFPAGYPLQGPKEAQYRQVGNAVAPIMAEMIGRAIIAAQGAA
jgi:DNA (cytosine-5)-methyltransferase 1